MNFTLHIWRQKNAESLGDFVTYQVNNIDGDTSFLEMLDQINEQLIEKGEDCVVFDYDCREGICGTCSLVINGHPHGEKMQLQPANYICETMPTRANSGLNRFVLQAFH